VMKIIRKLFIALSLSFIIYLSMALLMSFMLKSNNLEAYLLINLGGIFLTKESKINLLEILRVSIPMICYIYIITKFLLNDFVISAVYVFTRDSSICMWYLKKLFNLLMISFGYALMSLISTSLVGLVFGNKIKDYISFIKISLHILCLLTLVLFVYALISNIVAIITNPVMGYTISYLILIISILLPMVTKEVIRKVSIFIFPTCQYMLGLHCNNIAEKFNIGIKSISGFELSFSYVYLIFVSIILSIFGLVIIKKLDILNFDW